jgi:ribosome biogenesis GTPase
MYCIHVDFCDRDRAPRRDGLRDFGFDETFLKDYIDVASPGDEPARVVEVQRGRYGLALRGSEGEPREVSAVVSGRLYHDAEEGGLLPAVGDWVVVRRGGGDSGEALITGVLPRRSAVIRRAPADSERLEAQVLAANVDTAFIVAAADRRWSLRRIERYVTLACESGVVPVVVITKADMHPDGETLVAEAESVSPGVAVVLVCAPEGRGLEGLRRWLAPGRTVVLLGPSGAGKSTLLNALAGRGLADTRAVRSGDDRGRHTTTHRELFRLPSGALVIDNPGLRELQVLAGEEALAEAFADIARLAEGCRFRDCRHGEEPGCAVRAALESGELDAGHFAGWRKLGREAAFLAGREDPRIAAERAQRWKAINRSMRGYTKERRSIQGRSR